MSGANIIIYLVTVPVNYLKVTIMILLLHAQIYLHFPGQRGCANLTTEWAGILPK